MRRSTPKSAPMPVRRRRMTTSTEPRQSAALYRLLAWLSPSFPIGAFSYSHGLESVAASGSIHERASLQSWIAAIVAQGSGRMDADILRDAYRAALAVDTAALDAANIRGLAYRATAELALESAQQGDAFASTCLAAWPDPFLADWASHHPNPPPLAGEGVTDDPGLKPLPRKRGMEARRVSGGRVGVNPGEGVCLPAAFGAAAARAGIALED